MTSLTAGLIIIKDLDGKKLPIFPLLTNNLVLSFGKTLGAVMQVGFFCICTWA